MTSIDDLFKKPNLPSHKRKFEPLVDPDKVYKSVKLSLNGDTKGKGKATVQDEVDDDDQEAGPALPPDDEEDFGPDEDEEGRFFGSGVDKGTVAALDFLDSKESEPYADEKIESAWLRKTALNFEKKITKNAELRAKYETQPEKFMDSEGDLDADIKTLSILSEHPELYKEFAELGSAGSLVSLLAHENTDIAIAAIGIISELTDEDVEAEQEQWDSIVDVMLEADLMSLLLQNFERLDESIEEDRSGVYNSISILENLGSQTRISEKIVKESNVLKWLLDRTKLKETPVGQNKQYAAEVLAIFLQSSSPNRQRILELDAVDILLQLLSSYRKRDPEKDSAEEEFAENLFDSLTCLVDESSGKSKFVEAEGVELALIMLREAKWSKSRALRLLDHAAGGQHGAEVCEKIVDAAGLKTLFSMFMKKQDNFVTEHLLGIFGSLLRLLPGDSAPRIRTLAKFMEKDYEKIGKVIKLRRDYMNRIAAVDQQISRERANLDAEQKASMADVWFSQRLDAGLFCLQTIDVILAWLVAEDGGARERIMSLLAERDESLKDIKVTVQEQLHGFEGEKTEEEQMLSDMLETLIGFL
ncbi:DUF1716-domain-containing protein [Patellaria atrata CBS 101060]|uniref:DUF1716-domain-containing protein n=1 Tax=Patellaria atrata CBS 101060 TaxID=1346257 RepID=A0A9P4SD35_9PEZI|nr:DUF1716-domain-containing protein [Patellaria atrata CBS 101060]